MIGTGSIGTFMQQVGVEKSRLRDLSVLGTFLFMCFAVAAAGGAVTATSVNDWYQGLEKPWFTPPDWLFAPVWSVLFALMAVAGWRVWRVSGSGKAGWALLAFAVQLGLNLGWSILFFGMNLIGAALLEMFVLFGMILLTAFLFAKRDRTAGLLFVFYAVWVGFALMLNTSIWVLN